MAYYNRTESFLTFSKAQDQGIWAWDGVLNEPVLMIPMVLALLGDNPMQSEFACHIGLGGKFFCRACWVKGMDTLAEKVSGKKNPGGGDSEASHGETSGSEHVSEDAASDMGAGANSDTVNAPKKPKGRAKRAAESLASMVTRIKDFVTVRTSILFSLLGLIY